MLVKTQFQIVESPTEIVDPVTKFGGQPVWIAEPLWPLGPETGEQMLFLGQIALNEEMFPNSIDRMAYIFFENESEPLYNEAFAMVIQTKEVVHTSGHQIKYISKATGPTICELDDDRNNVYKEYLAILRPIENEDSVPLKERYTIKDLNLDSEETGYQFAKPELAGNKIGGQALYIGHLSRTPEHFTSDEWQLLLQLAPTQGYYSNLQANFYPFYMELVEFGILTVFVSRDYTRAVCCIQHP